MVVQVLMIIINIFSNASAQAAAPVVPFKVINVSPASLRWTSEHTLEVQEYRASLPPELVFSDDFEGRQCLVSHEECRAKTKIKLLPAFVDGQVRPQKFKISFFKKSKLVRYTVQILSSQFFSYSPVGRSSITKPLITSVLDVDHNSCQILMIAPDGKLQFYRTVNSLCIDFRPHVVGKKTFYSYENMKATADTGAWYGPRVLLDENFEFIRDYPGNFDMHEFLLFDENHFIAIEPELKRLKSGTVYVDRRIHEYQNGKLIFDWGVSDYLDQFAGAPVAGGYFLSSGSDSVADILHLNSVQVLDSDTLLIGACDNGVALLDKKTKKVKWQFAGFSDDFGVTAEQQPRTIHTAHLDVKTAKLLVFSNRLQPPPIVPAPAGVFEYDLDLDKKKVKSFSRIRAGPERSFAMGAVQKDSSGAYSITFGTKSSQGQKSFVEIKEGHEVMSVKFASPQAFLYRFYREPFGE